MGRLKQVEAVRLRERAGRLRDWQACTEHNLQIRQRPFKADIVQALVPWAFQYRSNALRYKFLVLRGGSKLDKSTRAKSLEKIFSLGAPFIQTAQGAPTPDLKDYDRERHGYVLFDNVNDMQFVLDHRA